MPIVLKNEGGGNLSGQVFAEPPWSVDGDPHYRMSAGKKASVALEFTPADEREYSGIVRVGSDPRAFMAVRGRGVAPITLAPEEIVVGREPSEARGFLLLLANRTPEPRTISFDWPDFVKAPHEITLQAGGNATVKATIPPDFLLAFNRSVEFQSEGFIGRITLKVDPAPARLVIASGNELNLGNLKNGGSAHGCFTVKNVGGTDARLQITAARELSVTPDPSSLILSPGKEQVFGVDFPATKVGAYVGTIAIKADSENATEVLVKASISKIDVPMLSTKVSGVTQPVEKFLQLAPRPSGISNVEQPLPAGSGPAFEEASVVLSTPHEIEISWKKLLPEMTEYRIERRRIMPGANDTVHIDWLPWPEVRVSIREADVSARFENLMSDSMWTIRIVAVDSAGVTRSRSKPFRVSTQPSTSLAFLWWSLGALCLGALVSLIRFWWREQARQAEAANMRLSRIGK